ncbi:metal-sensitive transcriptional regulator [Chitinibacteraceae bacterium HSL-7]
MSSADCHKTVVRPDKDALIKRARRAEGQLGGIVRMLDDDRYCVDILTQIAAARAALDGLAMQLLESHTRACVQDALHQGDGDAAVEEWLQVVRKLL